MNLTIESGIDPANFAPYLNSLSSHF